MMYGRHRIESGRLVFLVCPHLPPKAEKNTCYANRYAKCQGDVLIWNECDKRQADKCCNSDPDIQTPRQKKLTNF